MTAYETSFYDQIREGTVASAAVVVPLLNWVPDTVIDVGCGEGHWANAFGKLGSSVLGVDGDYVVDRVVQFQAVDLETQSLPPLRADLIICLEVIEHISLDAGRRLLREMCERSDTLLFSAAIPGQPGLGHINPQWQSWWAAEFAELGFETSQQLALDIWDDDRVEPWYRQNLMVARRLGTRPELDHLMGTDVMDLVHPIMWSWKL